MVLQRGMPVPVWGKASPNNMVTVRFEKQEKTAKADSNGNWRLLLDPMQACTAACDMLISDGNTVVLKNILVGEVWICSGQSNMEYSVVPLSSLPGIPNYQQELREANNPCIRLFKVPKCASNVPAADVSAQWLVSTASNLERSGLLACGSSEQSGFSAVGYLFAQEIYKKIKVPVGVIQAAWGGSRIESWTPPEGFKSVPSLIEFANAAGQAGTKCQDVVPGTHYFGMVQPLLPFAIKGVLWYQGESNVLHADSGAQYLSKMHALVNGWRSAWGQPDLPFYYVQIAPFTYSKYPNSHLTSQALPEVWEAQVSALSISNTGMVATTDLVENFNDIHPRNKYDVAKRLGYCALAKTYEYKNQVYSGPLFDKLSIRENKAVVSFKHVGSGLISIDGKPLSDFEVAGSDLRFKTANAYIQDDTVVVYRDDIEHPAAVRFAWNEIARPNLFNVEGLPALPFRAPMSAFVSGQTKL